MAAGSRSHIIAHWTSARCGRSCTYQRERRCSSYHSEWRSSGEICRWVSQVPGPLQVKLHVYINNLIWMELLRVEAIFPLGTIELIINLTIFGVGVILASCSLRRWPIIGIHIRPMIISMITTCWSDTNLESSVVLLPLYHILFFLWSYTSSVGLYWFGGCPFLMLHSNLLSFTTVFYIGQEVSTMVHSNMKAQGNKAMEAGKGREKRKWKGLCYV